MAKLTKRIISVAKGILIFKDWDIWLAERLGRRKKGLGLFRMRNGIALKMNFSRNDTGVFQEIWLMDFYQKFYHIKKGDTVVDIGAHIGAFSVLAASKGAKVYAYEPAPWLFELLKENTKGYDVTCFNMAVAGKSGEVEVESYEPPAEDADDSNPKTKHFNARAITLADIVAKAGYVNFLKIDCEGMETEILKNADKSVFEKIENIAMEYHHNRFEIADILKSKGFNILECQDGDFGYLWAVRKS